MGILEYGFTIVVSSIGVLVFLNAVADGLLREETRLMACKRELDRARYQGHHDSMEVSFIAH